MLGTIINTKSIGMVVLVRKIASFNFAFHPSVVPNKFQDMGNGCGIINCMLLTKKKKEKCMSLLEMKVLE